MQSYYKKFQLGMLSLASPSLTYLKISGLSFAFHHATPLVYRLSFEGQCRIPESGSVFLIEFIYDDHLLLNGDQLVLNDGRNWMYQTPSHWHKPSMGAYHEICIHSDIVQLPSGTHIVDAGIQLLAPFPNTAIILSAGKLIVELIQYSSNVNHGLPMLPLGSMIG
ncbi:unnamed protein product [Rotaria socialis]|uniref:Uncharacterized protein n=1 Tax=Rotaria socialis TaxID=392032 RepID=A0A818PFI1_9BILA|nr:unnamed protein product [Rotaria socialis]CAF3469097.1 unnamed protein product [Rotaria socialis]CAF3511398.1 unnamed protein product [Rotaria socialis]CAF3619262.1 unnamed protein product [Rotaria socialis]CAF4285059.1 unnamed protein product [Rotaria socialis]